MNIEYWSISKQRHAARPRMTIEEPKTALPSNLATQCELDGKAAMSGRKPTSLKHCRIVATNCRWVTARFGVEQRFSRPVITRAAGNRFRRRKRYHHASAAASADRCSSKSIWQRSRRAPAAAAMAHGAIIIIPWPPPPPSVFV